MRKRIRISAEKVEAYFVNVVLRQRKGRIAAIVRAHLFVTSKVFRVFNKFLRPS